MDGARAELAGSRADDLPVAAEPGAVPGSSGIVPDDGGGGDRAVQDAGAERAGGLPGDRAELAAVVGVVVVGVLETEREAVAGGGELLVEPVDRGSCAARTIVTAATSTNASASRPTRIATSWVRRLRTASRGRRQRSGHAAGLST